MSDTPTIAECFEEIRFASEEAKESRPWEIWTAFDEAVNAVERRIESLEKENERLADTLIQDHDRYKGHIERLEAALREIIETPAAVEIRGGCAYCESKAIARQALEHQSGR